VVNDRREFGTYVGQHGLVMENGQPSASSLSLPRPAGVVYDLVAGRLVPTTTRAGRLTWPVDLGSGDGGVFLVTPRAIGRVEIAAPETARTGNGVEVTIRVTDDAGEPVPAVVPLQVAIADPAGRSAEFSGYYVAQNGTLRLRLDLAANDRPGVWQIQVRELASGRAAVRYLRVQAERSTRP